MGKKEIFVSAGCPACGGVQWRADQIATRILALPETHQIVRCRTCGTSKLAPELSAQEIDAMYAGTYFTYDESDYRKTSIVRFPKFSRIAEELKSLYPGGRKILDVGAATGGFVVAASRAGLEASGIEYSADAVHVAKKSGVDLMVGELSSVKNVTYDFLHLSHVLEHFQRPTVEMGHVKRLLAQDGILYIQIPYQFHVVEKLKYVFSRRASKPSLHSFHHPYMYTPASLRLLLEREGFQILRQRVFDIQDYPLSHVVNRVKRWAWWILGGLGIGNTIEIFAKKIADETTLESHFGFGKNWEKLVGKISDESVRSAMTDIQQFLGRPSLEGIRVLDIGCGSGLTSLAVYRLGAKHITSVDIDPVNIHNAKTLKAVFGVPDRFPWTIRQVNAVRAEEMANLPQGDLVVSWGVLHHTGAMWQALDNTASLVSEDGLLYIMLYRDAVCASMWKKIKKFYTYSGKPIQFLMRNMFAGVLLLGLTLKHGNPLPSIRSYGKKSRGMSWYIDVTDWVGGYPFEYASYQEVVDFLSARGFMLKKVDPLPDGQLNIGWRGTGSYTYLFQRVAKRADS